MRTSSHARGGVRDPRERLVEDGDVVGGGLRAGVPGRSSPAKDSPELVQNAGIG
jgi:hypothetical protein